MMHSDATVFHNPHVIHGKLNSICYKTCIFKLNMILKTLKTESDN